MFYELTKKEIPRLDFLRVTAKVSDDSSVKILDVDVELPGHTFGVISLNGYYISNEPKWTAELRGWILEYHHEQGESLRREQVNDARFDLGFNEHENSVA